MEDHDEHVSGQIRDALESLPVFDDLYLRMQALNIDMVDSYLSIMENDLLMEYIEIEHTPIEMALLVSALSQMWIFGLYELLRTWRQRATDIARFGDTLKEASESEKKQKITRQKQKIKKAVALEEAEKAYWWPFEMAAKDTGFVESIYSALDHSERLFHRIEALRIFLAKHELPKDKGSFAMAPGYGRIDMSDGSIYWGVSLEGNEIDLVSRQAIARDCRVFSKDRSQVFLSKNLQKKILCFPKRGYGTKMISVLLDDGTKYSKVIVAWSKEVIHVGGYEEVPFDARKVVDVHHEPEE